MFDPTLHQPIRTRIAAFLRAHGNASFKELKERLELTDGNLSSHMRVLEKEGYVEVEKFFEGRRPKTLYRLSEAGNRAFREYVAALQAFLEEEQ